MIREIQAYVIMLHCILFSWEVHILHFEFKGLGAIRAKIGPNSDVDKIFSKMYSPEINPHCILSQIYALFIEFYYALFLFLYFKDMYYNTMIRTFCILKKMTFSAFHYLTLSIRCEEDGLLFSTICFTWYNLSLFWSLHLSEVILWCWNCMNDLKKSDLKMSSLNVRTTYHIYYFTCCDITIRSL
jgi:hypothetical protein